MTVGPFSALVGDEGPPFISAPPCRPLRIAVSVLLRVVALRLRDGFDVVQNLVRRRRSDVRSSIMRLLVSGVWSATAPLTSKMPRRSLKKFCRDFSRPSVNLASASESWRALLGGRVVACGRRMLALCFAGPRAGVSFVMGRD